LSGKDAESQPTETKNAGGEGMTSTEIMSAIFFLVVVGYILSLAIIFFFFTERDPTTWTDGDPGPKWGKDNEKKRD
jgi:hypothetical protein